MTKRKLPTAKDWRNRDLSDWNTLTFCEYLKATHKERFGIDYAPFGGTWSMEQGILGDLIGTASRTNPKPRTASNEAVKRFIDETFEAYRPTAKYPGTSFGFMYTYRKTEWQRIMAEELAKEKRDVRQQEAEETNYTDLDDWL